MVLIATGLFSFVLNPKKTYPKDPIPKRFYEFLL